MSEELHATQIDVKLKLGVYFRMIDIRNKRLEVFLSNYHRLTGNRYDTTNDDKRSCQSCINQNDVL
jgi:hypothetical protein